MFAQSLPCQPAVDAAYSRQFDSAKTSRLSTAAIVPLQGCGLVHMQSLALLIDCLQLYASFGSCEADQARDSIASRQTVTRLDQLLALLVTAEARASAMRVLLLASKPAVGRHDYVNAVQGGKSRPSCCYGVCRIWPRSFVLSSAGVAQHTTSATALHFAAHMLRLHCSGKAHASLTSAHMQLLRFLCGSSTITGDFAMSGVHWHRGGQHLLTSLNFACVWHFPTVFVTLHCGFAAGRGATHPSRLLSDFLRWLLCSGQVSPAAVTPSAVVTMHQLAFAPLRQLISWGVDAATPQSVAEEVTTQQRMVAGVLWCICQVPLSPAAQYHGVVFLYLSQCVRIQAQLLVWLHRQTAT